MLKDCFLQKKSIDQLAAMLGVSRATADNDLNHVRKMKKQTRSL